MRRRVHSFLIALCAFALPAQAAPTDPHPLQPGIDVEHYAFHLVLSEGSTEILGEATLTVHRTRGAASELRLDLVQATGDRDGQGMRVERVAIDGRTARYSHDQDVLTIALPAATAERDRLAVQVTYRGTPANGLRIGPNRHGDLTFFSDNWPDRARHWLPTVDHIGDKATHEFIVDAPARFQVVSNGLRIEETDLGQGVRRTHWRQSVPTAPWLYCLGVAEFAVQRLGEFDGKEIQVWVFPEDREAGFADLNGPTRPSLEFFSDYVGPFAYEKLANVQAPSVAGGMEAASAIFYSEASSTGAEAAFWRRNAIIHEIAHQWFGNAVTEATWDDVWLSEGITTYFTLLFREHAYGWEDFAAGLKDARRTVWRFHQDNPDYTIIHRNLQDMSKVTSSHTYQKGAWVMHMLRRRIGDEAFRQGIRDYYAAHFNGSATSDDLEHAMESASGQDLGSFFDQWLRQGGHPVLEGSWHFENGTLTVELSEVQTDGYLFDLPVEIGVYEQGADLPTIHVLRLSDRSRRTLSLPLAAPPARVELDPRTNLLAEWTFGVR
ncbi:MAG: M1 family metallopeptidase [Gemmatimonadota bacterium]